MVPESSDTILMWIHWKLLEIRNSFLGRKDSSVKAAWPWENRTRVLEASGVLEIHDQFTRLSRFDRQLIRMMQYSTFERPRPRAKNRLRRRLRVIWVSLEPFECFFHSGLCIYIYSLPVRPLIEQRMPFWMQMRTRVGSCTTAAGVALSMVATS